MPPVYCVIILGVASILDLDIRVRLPKRLISSVSLQILSLHKLTALIRLRLLTPRYSAA